MDKLLQQLTNIVRTKIHGEGLESKKVSQRAYLSLREILLACSLDKDLRAEVYHDAVSIYITKRLQQYDDTLQWYNDTHYPKVVFYIYQEPKDYSPKTLQALIDLLK